MFNKDAVRTIFEGYLSFYDVKNYTRRDWQGGYQWIFPLGDHWTGDIIYTPSGDVIYTPYSYNNQNGYVESMGFDWDTDDVSSLPPEEMARRIAGYAPRSEREYHYSFAECVASFVGAMEDGN